MSANAGIYFRQMGVPDYLGAAQEGMSFGQMIKKNRMADEDREKKNKIKELYSKSMNVDENGRLSLDNAALKSGLTQLAPEKAYQLQNAQDKQEKSDLMAKSKADFEKRKYSNSRSDKEREFELKQASIDGQNLRAKSELAFKNKQLAANGNKKDEIKADQYKVGGFAKRARMAEQELSKLPTDAGTGGFSDTIQGNSFYPESWKSQERKKFEQGQRNFISAVLRRESGAAISDQEMENESMKYFGQPGDGAEVLAQKARARKQAMINLESEAGGALDKIATAPEEKVKKKDQPNIPGVSDAYASNPLEHPMKNQALEWAKQNPDNPNAARILQRLGM